MTVPRAWLAAGALVVCTACATGHKYHDPQMDFSSIRTVAVLPFSNLTRETGAPDRVRDVFSNMLLATGAMYVLPSGEIARGVTKAAIQTPTSPAAEDVVKLGGVLKADAIITGVVREYGEVRSGGATANVVSLSVQLFETTTGKVVWSASTTRGGVDFLDRLLGGGGTPMNKVTEEAVGDLLNRLFKTK